MATALRVLIRVCFGRAFILSGLLALLSQTAIADPTVTATLISPTNLATVPPTTTFQWTAVNSAQAYYLYVGSTAGAKDIVNSGEIQSTSLEVSGLPIGQTVYVLLWTKVSGTWQSVSATVTVGPIAVPLQPINGATGVDPRSNVTWTAVPNAEAYYLYVGTSQGAKDLINSGETQLLAWPLYTVPAGTLVYGRLWTKFAGLWLYVDFTFQLLPVAVPLSPQQGQAAVDPRVQLTWTSVPNAQAYYVYIGSSPGAKDIVNSGEISQLYWPLSAVPLGQLVYCRLWTKYAGTWLYVDLSFQRRPVAVLLNPGAGATGVDTRFPLSWTAVGAAQAYYVYAGTTQGAKDLINSGELQGTQYPAAGLPAGQLVYLRLWTKMAGSWLYVDSTFTTEAVAYLNATPPTGATLDTDVPFSWSAFPGASAYYIYVGTTQGLNDLANSGEIYGTTQYTLTTAAQAAIPAGASVWVRFFSLVNGQWLYIDYQMTVEPKSVLQFPTNGASGVDVTRVTFSWTPVSQAQSYRLAIGTQPGAADVLDSGLTNATSFSAWELPGGAQLYARIWTLAVDGVWRYSDSNFSTRAASTFLYPRLGQLGLSGGTTFQWTSVAGADAYQVSVGSTLGAADLFQSGLVSTTSMDVGALPAASVLYARVQARTNGTWQTTDIVFSTGATPGAAITYPGTGGSFDASQGFQWTLVPVAFGYRLQIGTTPGAADLLDTGTVKVTRRLLGNLPVGQTLYGQLTTQFGDGTSSSQSFQFTVTNPNVSSADQWTATRWAVAAVRGMALMDGSAEPTSLLSDAMHQDLHSNASCTDYALAEIAYLQQLNAGMPARQLNVCLNPNSYDCHTLVEVYDSTSATWEVIDPTFGLIPHRSTDGGIATSADMSNAARAMTWTAINYEFVTAATNTYAQAYYLDYPLLFVNVYQPGSSTILVQPTVDITPLYSSLQSNSVTAAGMYAVQCPVGMNSVTLLLNGQTTQISCQPGLNWISPVAAASSISPLPSGVSNYVILTPVRNVF